MCYTIPVDRDVTVADDPAVGKYPVNFIREEQHEGSEKCRLLKYIFVYNVSIKFIVQYSTVLTCLKSLSLDCRYTDLLKLCGEGK